MANNTTTYQCPSCNGKLFFKGNAGKLQCEFCDSQYTVEEIEQLYGAKQEKADQKVSAERLQQFGIAQDKLTDAQQTSVAAVLADLQQGVITDQEAKSKIDAIVAAGKKPLPTAAQASTSEATKAKIKDIQSTGDPIQDYLARAKWDDGDAENMRAFSCPACGAQLMVDQVTAVTSCPYCGNNAVIPGQLSDLLKPDVVIPFKVDKDAAVKALKKYYEGKKFLPNTFTEGNHIEEIQGVYVPFWLYSGTGYGSATFNASNVRTWTDAKNSYTETDHFVLEREGTVRFEKVPVDGSTKMPDAHMDAIEPYDYRELQPFSVAYLPGYITERYDQDAKTCESRARDRAQTSTENAIAQTGGGYEVVEVANARADVRWDTVQYALLPVWMLHTKRNGDDFLFAMNGQTGKFIGDLPIDGGKVRKRFLAIFAPIAAVAAVALFALFGF